MSGTYSMYKAAYQKHTLSIFMYNIFLLCFDVLHYFNICVTETSRNEQQENIFHKEFMKFVYYK